MSLMWGAYFCMGAYKRDVVVVIKMGAYIFKGCLFCVGAYYPDYTVIVEPTINATISSTTLFPNI